MATPARTMHDRVLVVRLSAMGDIIHALPAVTALRQAAPEINIGWLVEERWAELLCARSSAYAGPLSDSKPLVDQVHVANFKAWRKSLGSGATWRAMSGLRDKIHRQHYGIALDLQGAIRSALAARVSGAKIRIGSLEPREAPARMFYTRQVEPRCEHVVEHALELVSTIVGRPLSYTDPVLPVDPAAEAWADKLTDEQRAKPLAILNPGAGWGAKCWPTDSFGKVARDLTERGMAIAINHAPGEEALAEAVQSASANTATPVKCSISELIALTRRAKLFVGGDTGPMHLAAALRVPVVALFGPTRPERNGPYRTRSVVLRNPGSIDNTTHTDTPDEGLLSITPREVVTAADQLLGEARD